MPGPSPARTRAGPRQLLFRPNVRILVGGLLILAFLLAAASLGTAWWSFTATLSNGTDSVNFLPGSSYSVSCSGNICGNFAGSLPYSSFGGSVGSLYGSFPYVVIVAVALAGMAALLGTLGAFGRDLGKRQLGWTLLFGAAAVGLLLTALIWVAAAQPGSFASGTSFPGTGPATASPSSSFWGSASVSAGTATWGGGLGWYLAASSAALLCVVVVLLLWRSRSRFAPEPKWTYPARRPPTVVSPRYVPPPPVARSVARSSAALTPATVSSPPPAPVVRPVTPELVEPISVICPACGTTNVAKSPKCSYCQRPLR